VTHCLPSEQAKLAAELTAHLRDVFAYLKRLGLSSADAEDLAQDTFVIAWQGLGKLRERRKLRSWLHGIAHRRYLRHQEATAAHRPVLTEDVGAACDGLTPGGEHHVLAHAVRQALRNLPPEYRHPLQLLYWEGLSYREAANVLSLPIGTLAWRVHKALKLMRRALAEKGVGDVQAPAEAHAAPCSDPLSET
jgi:RNA polymerase sigma-70 factor (ECF subfamily)